MIYNICNRVYVMYSWNIVEVGDVESVFESPHHPYFRALMGSLPKFGSRQDSLADIPGMIPNFLDPPPGCRFHPRCAFVFERCKTEIPTLCQVGDDHWVACFRGMEGESV